MGGEFLQVGGILGITLDGDIHLVSHKKRDRRRSNLYALYQNLNGLFLTGTEKKKGKKKG